MPVQLVNCTLPKLMEGQKLTQGALRMLLQMSPQWTFYSDKFLIYFQMVSEFLAHLLSAVSPPRTVWVLWAVGVRLSPSGLEMGLEMAWPVPQLLALCPFSGSNGWMKVAGLTKWHQIPRLEEDRSNSSFWKKGGVWFQNCGVLFSWDYQKKMHKILLKYTRQIFHF